MPTLDAYRIINITYDHGKNRMEDMTIEQEGQHTIVVIPNGCGKTYSITLLLQTIIPGSKLGNRTFEESFSDVRGTAHIVTSHNLDNSESRLFTGFTVNTEGSLKYFNWCLETEKDMTLQTLPLVSDNICLSYDETREWLKTLPFERRIRIFNQGEGKKLSSHLNTYGIFRDEWEMMCRMNQNEGGIREIFDTKSRKSTDDLLSEFVIPALKRELKGIEEVDQVQSSFLKKIETLKMIPKWEEEIHRMNDYLSAYQIQLEKLKKLYDREEDFRIGLYILKLINERTVKKTNTFNKHAATLQLRIQAEKEGQLKLEKQGKRLEYANKLYQLEQTEIMLSEIHSAVETYEKATKQLEDNQKRNLALDELEKYNSETARYEVIRQQLESQREESAQLKQDMEILESKLNGYYTIAIQKKLNALDSNTELAEKAEMEKEEILLKKAAIKMEKVTKEKETALLKRAEMKIDKLGGYETYEMSKMKIGENRQLEEENTERLIQTEEQRKKNQQQLTELEREEFILKERLKDEMEKLRQFNQQKDTLSQILKLFHLEQPDELLDHLQEAEDELQTHILSKKTEISKMEEIVEYCIRYDTLPPDGEIRKLTTQLKTTGFQDFIPGYEYLREHDSVQNNLHSVQNNLLEYGIICENLRGLSAALKKIKRPDWPVMVFSRKEINKKPLLTEQGLMTFNNLMIETEFLSLTAGELSIETYIQKKQKKIEQLTTKIQKQRDKQKEIEMYRKITEQFIEKYGIDMTNTQNTLKENFTKANNLWNGCSDKVKELEISVVENDELLTELQKKNRELERENRQHQKMIDDFEKIHRDCIHIVNTLSEIPNRIEETEKLIRTLTLTITDTETLLKKQREHLTRIVKKSREITEELGILKQKKRQYRPHPSDSLIYTYADEAVESLEEKLAMLKLRFDNTQLIEEETRTKNLLNQIMNKIIQYGYSIDHLREIDRTTLPSYEECAQQLSILRKEIQTAQTHLGQNREKKRHLLNDCENINLGQDEKERIQPMNQKEYDRAFSKNARRLQSLEGLKKANERESKQVLLRIHEFEILKASQNTFLAAYKLPEKLRIKQLDPKLFTMSEKEAWEKNRTKFLKSKEALESDRKIVETGWNTIRKATGSEQFEMNLSMAMVMEGEGGNILFDYLKIKSVFEQDSTLIENARKMLKTNIEKNKQEMDTLVENAYRSVECYINEFNNLSKFSKIETHGRRDRAVKFIFPELSRETKIENLQRYINEILQQINQIEQDRIATFVKKNFDVKRLIEEIHRKKIILKVYKPSTTAGWYYEDWDNVIKWSGGEQFFAFFLLYASMSIWIRQKRTRSNQSKTCLIADNPFGQAISEHIFNPLLEFMTDNQIQFLTFTAIKDRETLALFPNKYSLVLQKSAENSSLRIQPGFFREDL